MGKPKRDGRVGSSGIERAISSKAKVRKRKSGNREKREFRMRMKKLLPLQKERNRERG